MATLHASTRRSVLVLLGLHLAASFAPAVANAAQKLTIISPPRRAKVSGMVNIEIQPPAEATKIITYVDHHALSSSATSVIWDSTRAHDGWHAISARAYDSTDHLLGRSSLWVRSANGSGEQLARQTRQTRQNGLVADAVGITGSCTGTAGTATYSCSYSHPVTCTCSVGGNTATVSGYTLSSADVGKDIDIGFPVSQDKTTCPTGAGSGNCLGVPIRVHIGSVNTATNSVTFGSAIGSSPTTCQNSVTNADCEIGTDNESLLQTLVTNNTSITVGSGRYLMDGTAVNIPSGHGIVCQPGAIFVIPKNDAYNGSYNTQRVFIITGGSGQSITGPCTFIGTNTAGDTNQAAEPNGNHYIHLVDQTGCTQTSGSICSGYPNHVTIGGNSPSVPMVFMFTWPDSPVELSGANYNTVQNIISYVGWAFGPSIIWGAYNTFSNITGIDNSYFDIEPNSSAEGGAIFGNTITGSYWIDDGNFIDGQQTNLSFGANSNCNSTSCNTGTTVSNNNATGGITFWPTGISGCVKPITTSYIHTNSTGTPSCVTCGGGYCGTLQ